MIDTTKLRELAQQATPGPWEVVYCDIGRHEICDGNFNADHEHIGSFVVMADDDAESPFPIICEHDAEYIAAANPATVLALMDEIAAMREDLNDARSEFEHVAAGLNDAAQRIARQSQTISRLQDIEAAALNLAKVKGRHHSEQAMNQLLEALK